MKTKISIKVACMLIATVFIALAWSNLLAQANVVTINERYSETRTVWVPCANDGEGEWVRISGTMHYLLTITFDALEGFHAKGHTQPQGMSGIGLTTGDKYRATGVTQWQETGRSLRGCEYSVINRFMMIGQGPGNNFRVRETFHFTMNANGEVTARVDNFEVDCK